MTPSSHSPAPVLATHQRLLHVDALRGLMLVFMAVNHVPNEVDAITNHTFGFVSAAEGFVFLAGLVAGMVYTRKLAKAGFPAMRHAGVQRAISIYGYHVAALGVVFAWFIGSAVVTGAVPDNAPELLFTQPLQALLGGLALVFQPSLLDVLPMYCGFMLALPLLVAALDRGYRGPLVALSFAAWVLANAFIPQAPVVKGSINTGAFNVAAWQFLFVAGIVFGHAWARKESLLPAPRAWLIALIAVACGLLWAVRHALVSFAWQGPALDWLTNKNNLAPLRLINVGLLFYLVALALGRFPQIMQWRSLAFLGQHSLPIFAAHVVVATAINSQPSLFANTVEGRWLATALMVAALFAAGGLHVWFTRKPTNASTVPQAAPTPRLQTRQPWTGAAMVGHGKRAFGPADPVHR